MVEQNIGAYISTQIGTPPATWDAAAQILGTAYDRTAYQSATIHFQVAAFVTTPTSYLATPVLQHSSSSTTSFTAFATASAGFTTGAVAADFNVNLLGAKQWIRLYVPTPTLSGTFQAKVSGVVILGGATSTPV